MPSPCFFVALYCSVGLVFLAEASVPENPDVLSDNVIDSSIVNGASTGKYDVPVVRSIELSTEPPWSGNYVVNNITREIDVLPEEAIKETLAIRDLFAKYFDFIPPHQLGFDGRGIARYLDNLGDQRTLEIAPLRPGTYSFEYRNKEKDLVKRVWKVHSVPSFFVQPGSFFEFELNFTRTQVSSSSKTSDLKSIGVRVDPKRGFPVIYGLANDIQNGTVLKLRTDSVDLGASTMKIRLLLAERREPGRSCNNKKKPCLESITVWMKNFNMTIQNQESFAECLATLFGKKKSDLYGVRFQDYGSDAKIFEAKLLDVYLCKYLEYSSEKIGGCFPGVIGFNLTCGPKMKAVKTPPAPIFAAPTGKFLEISGAMGADTIEASSTTARIATEVPTDPGPDYWVSPLELETVPQNPNVDSRESISTTADTVPGTFDTIGDSADQLPSHSILNVTSSNDSKSSTTATSDAGVNFTSTPGIPSESLSTPYIGSVEVSSTTAEAVPGSFNTIGDAADDVRSNTILIDSESSTTATSDAGLDFSSTSGSPPESSSTPFIGSIEVSLTTAEAFLEPLTTVGPDSVAVSTLGSVDRNITSTPNLVPPPPADSSTPSNSGSGDNPEAAGVNRARDVPAKAYESFVEHALSYAIVWAAVFMVLFILIACTSR